MEKRLTLNQQLALMPVSIPDTILDFLEDFAHSSALQTESVRAAIDPEYLKAAGDTLKVELEKIRQEKGKILQLHIEQWGREIPGAFGVKMECEKGSVGIGILTRLKEKTILKVMLQMDAYNETALRDLLRNPK